MDESTVVDQLFYSDTDDDWNNSDEEDSFVHGEDSFVLDRLTREQDDDYGDVEENDREEEFSNDEEDTEEETNDDYEVDVRYCEGHDESSHPGPSGLHSGVSDGGMGSLETEYPCGGSPVAYDGSPVSSSLPSRSSSPHAPFSPSDRGRDYSPSPSDPLSGRNRGRGRGRGMGRGTVSPMDLVPSRGRRKGTGRGRGTGRDLAINNASTLECCFTPVNDCRTIKSFMDQLATKLLCQHSSRQHGGRQSQAVPPQSLARLEERHFIENLGTDGDCAVCSDRKTHRKRTKYGCVKCGMVHLCLENCFKIYHTKTFYRFSRCI